MYENKTNYEQARAQCEGVGYATDRGAMLGAAAQMDGCAAGRMSSKGALRQRVHFLRREADRLEALSRALPEELPVAADEALWDLLSAKL